MPFLRSKVEYLLRRLRKSSNDFSRRLRYDADRSAAAAVAEGFLTEVRWGASDKVGIVVGGVVSSPGEFSDA